jgi:Arc/MetJ family transcription regulator
VAPIIRFLKENHFSAKVANAMRRKTTVYLEDDLLRATKVAAARVGKRDYQVVEEALRAYLGLELLERVGVRSELKEDEALDLAYRELHQSRRS